MSYINAKKESEHPSDHDKTNNGGLMVVLLMGATPEQKVGDKVTQVPEVNNPVSAATRPIFSYTIFSGGNA
jgi:hypothetical protein